MGQETAMKLFDTMKERGLCNDPNQNPVLHVWFARDKGANYGFCEIASMEETDRALQLDGMMVLGVIVFSNTMLFKQMFPRELIPRSSDAEHAQPTQHTSLSTPARGPARARAHAPPWRPPCRSSPT